MSKTRCNRIVFSLLCSFLVSSTFSTQSLFAQSMMQAPTTQISHKAEKADEKFCVNSLVLDQAPNLAFSFWSESTCELCGESGAQIQAENFVLAEPTVITEVVLWGWYFPNNTPPPHESWTVIFHRNTDGEQLPGEVVASEMVVPASRSATGRSAVILDVDVDEQRWLLKLSKPVKLDSGSYWIEIYHDSPVANADTSIEYGDPDLERGMANSAVSLTAPGDEWIAQSNDFAMQICGFDARWDGLLVPGFEIDGSNPADTTLIAARNTSDGPLSIDISYYGERIDNSPFLVKRVDLGRHQTHTANVGLDLAALAGNGVISGLIIISEADGGSANIEGDFSRVDFANDFAAGERMLEPSAFCRVQEIRAVDFGSGSDFNIVMRNVDPSVPAFSVSSLDEAGNSLQTVNVFTGANVLELPISQLAAGLSFGTLLFDFSGSDGGIVTGRYSAFGRFSTEVNGACRD